MPSFILIHPTFDLLSVLSLSVTLLSLIAQGDTNGRPKTAHMHVRRTQTVSANRAIYVNIHQQFCLLFHLLLQRLSVESAERSTVC